MLGEAKKHRSRRMMPQRSEQKGSMAHYLDIVTQPAVWIIIFGGEMS